MSCACQNEVGVEYRPLPATIGAMLDAAAAEQGIEPELARAVAWVESRGNPLATSKAGAMGVMQLMPQTAAGLGVRDAYDAASNIRAGVRYLARLVLELGKAAGLAAYNWGPSRVRAKPDSTQWPQQVRTYVARVRERLQLERAAAGISTAAQSSVSARRAPKRPADSAYGAGALLLLAAVSAAVWAAGRAS